MWCSKRIGSSEVIGSLVFIVILINIGHVNARIGFVKDQSITRIEFPPRITKAFEGSVPTGHMRPLGWQRQPDGRVPEEKTMPTPEHFYKTYVNTSRPVVFRNAVSNVPATDNWKKDDYLKEHYGTIQVHAVVKKEQYEKGVQKVQFKKFLREYHYEDWYLSNIVPQEMMPELILPSCLRCGMRKFLTESEIWMSSGGTNSLLHSHADHDLHCLLSGRKDFVLIHPRHSSKLHFTDKPPHKGDGYSRLDTDRINMFRYRSLGEAPWTWTTLQPGDCVYIPAGYPHQVRSYGRSFSSTMLWAPTQDVSFADCEKEDMASPLPLSEANFMWMYQKADRELSNIRLSAPSLRHHLTVWCRDDDHLSFPVFKDYYDEIMSELDDQPPALEVWQMMALEETETLSRSVIPDMGGEQLDKIAEILNRPHVLHGHEKEPSGKDEL